MDATLWVGQVFGQREDRAQLELQGVVLGDYDPVAGCFINAVLTKDGEAAFKRSAADFTWAFNKVTVH